MKVFFFMGRNSDNRSGVSWKIWKINRRGRTVVASWGPAVLRRRRVVPARPLQSRTWSFKTTAAAQASELVRVGEKLRKGYVRQPRARR